MDLRLAVTSAADARALATTRQRSGIAIMAKLTFTAESCASLLDVVLAHPPFMAETKFDNLDTLRRVTARLAPAGVPVWVNTLDISHCMALNDTLARRDPDAVWGVLVDAGVTVIQTDLTERLNKWLMARRAAACLSTIYYRSRR